MNLGIYGVTKSMDVCMFSLCATITITKAMSICSHKGTKEPVIDHHATYEFQEAHCGWVWYMLQDRQGKDTSHDSIGHVPGHRDT